MRHYYPKKLSGLQRNIILMFILFLSSTSSELFSQNQILALRIKKKVIHTFTKGEYIAFLDNSKNWQYGIISRIWKDSFIIRPYLLQRNNSLDTVSYYLDFYSLSDIYAVPKRGFQIEDIQSSNHHQINGEGGQVYFFWIKAGWLFRALGLGYAGLNIFNSLIVKNQTIEFSGLCYAAGSFIFGEFLKNNYKPYLKLDKRYNLKIF